MLSKNSNLLEFNKYLINIILQIIWINSYSIGVTSRCSFPELKRRKQKMAANNFFSYAAHGQPYAAAAYPTAATAVASPASVAGVQV